jgi:hypothetical protein
MTHEQNYQLGMQDAYALMDKTISGAIKRNGGAVSALQIINVFNEFTAHLHYQQSLLADRLAQTQSTEPIFGKEITDIEGLLQSIGFTMVKGGQTQ